MRELLRSTIAYRLYAADARKGSTAHTTLVLFPDEVYLRALLTECAKAFFAASDGSRVASLVEKESYADCLFYPPAEEKYTAEGITAMLDECLLRPVEGDRRLFVLDRFHTASPIVQNKLLKALEEPPAGVFFLLGATAEHAVLPTVLSRAKKLSVPPFAEEEVAAALSRMHPGESVGEAAAACGGVVSAAENLLAGGGEDFVLAERLLLEEDVGAVCREIGEKKSKSFFAALKLVLRDALLCAEGQEKYCARKSEGVLVAAKRYPAGALGAALRFATDAERDIKFNANPGQAALALSLRLGEEWERWQRLS